MRDPLRKTFKFIARLFTVLCAVLAVIATILVLLLLSFKHILLNAETYKQALVENRVYEQLPFLVADQLSLVKSLLGNPCAGNPLPCVIEDTFPELQACLRQALGTKALEDIGSRMRTLTEAETQTAQTCLDQYGIASQPGPESESPNKSPLAAASAEARACAREALGEEVYVTLYKQERPATTVETRRINSCIRQVRRAAQAKNPGIGGDITAFLKNLTSNQWKELIVHLLPSDELQKMSETTLDQVFAYLNGETDSAQMPLVNLKARLTGAAGEELLLRLLNAQPSCTEGQMAQINAGNFENGAESAIYCAASGETLAKMLPDMRKRLSKVVSQIPDKAALIKPASASDASSRKSPLGNNPHAALKKLNAGIRFSPLLPLALLLLVALFAVRSLRDWMRWWSIPIFIGSLITLIIGIALFFMFDWAWVKYILPQITLSLASGFGEIGHDLAQSVVDDLAKWIMLESGLVTLLALGVIVASSYVKPPPDPSLPPLYAPGTPGGPVIHPPHKKKGKGW